MSAGSWWQDLQRLRAVDRAHRAARQRWLFGSQLVPVGKVSTWLGVALAIGCGSLLLAPADERPSVTMLVVLGLILASHTPFGVIWTKFTDFERLHAPPAGLLLLRLTRVAPWVLLIGAVWAAMLATRRTDPAMLLAVGCLPATMCLTGLLRGALVSSALRLAIAGAFLFAWLGGPQWLPFVTLALQAVGAVAFVRELAAIDRDGIPPTGVGDSDGLDAVRAEIAATRPLPDLRTAPRRSLFGSAWFLALAGQRDLPGLWQRRPLTVTMTNLLVVAFWTASAWLACIAVVRSHEQVALLWCAAAALLSISPFELEREERLYLWGVDLRQVERHNVAARLLTVALPTVAAASLAALWSGGGEVRWTAVAMVAAMQLVRTGIAAFHVGTAILLVAALLVGLLLAGAAASMPERAAGPAAGAVATFGLIGIALRLWRSENGLRERAFA